MRNTFSTANSLGADAEAPADASRSSEDADGRRGGPGRTGVVAEEGEAGWGEGAEEAAHPIRARRESLGRRR